MKLVVLILVLLDIFNFISAFQPIVQLTGSNEIWYFRPTLISQFGLVKRSSLQITCSSFNIVSPFVSQSELSSNDNIVTMELNAGNVDKVLNIIRPLLIKDGGNVAVHKVDIVSRSIEIMLQGACSSCPSSTTTMKMGVEKVLREHFHNITEIVAFNAKNIPPVLSMVSVMKQLEGLIPAITALGGNIIVRDVIQDTGHVLIGFNGPFRLRKAIELILKEDFTIKEVIFDVYSRA